LAGAINPIAWGDLRPKSRPFGVATALRAVRAPAQHGGYTQGRSLDRLSVLPIFSAPVKTRYFTSDAEVATLVQAFEEATISASEFNHFAHIAVALSYMEHRPVEEALARMRLSIKRFASHHGAGQLYHETLTTFWMRLLGHLRAVYQVDLPLWRRINLITQRWGTRHPVEAHYSKELLDSPEARAVWVAPDRLPLAF
jgi:hypothetical protein